MSSDKRKGACSLKQAPNAEVTDSVTDQKSGTTEPYHILPHGLKALNVPINFLKIDSAIDQSQMSKVDAPTPLTKQHTDDSDSLVLYGTPLTISFLQKDLLLYPLFTIQDYVKLSNIVLVKRGNLWYDKDCSMEYLI